MPFYYIDMELCDGNLENYIQGTEFPQTRNPRLHCFADERRSIRVTLDILEQIANGLKFIHAQGPVHRDLKPRNS